MTRHVINLEKQARRVHLWQTRHSALSITHITYFLSHKGRLNQDVISLGNVTISPWGSFSVWSFITERVGVVELRRGGGWSFFSSSKGKR